MLPLDYADRGVARQRRNVGRLVGFTSLAIVAIGAFRLSQSLKSEEPIGLHLIEITVIFSMASTTTSKNMATNSVPDLFFFGFKFPHSILNVISFAT